MHERHCAGIEIRNIFEINRSGLNVRRVCVVDGGAGTGLRFGCGWCYTLKVVVSCCCCSSCSCSCSCTC